MDPEINSGWQTKNISFMKSNWAYVYVGVIEVKEGYRLPNYKVKNSEKYIRNKRFSSFGR